jgi:hypothetical protein
MDIAALLRVLTQASYSLRLRRLLGGGASFPAVRGGGGGSLRPMLVDVLERPGSFEMLVRFAR